MKIAVPLFKKRIAPHFGASGNILLIDIEGGAIRRETILDVGHKSAMEIARLLVELGVNRLICGGIQHQYKEWLLSKGIGVMYNQKGEAKGIIKNLLKSKATEQSVT